MYTALAVSGDHARNEISASGQAFLVSNVRRCHWNSRHSLRGPVPVGLQSRRVTVWPQWPYDESAHNAKLIGDPEFKWPPPKKKSNEELADEEMTPQEAETFRTKVHSRMAESMRLLDWSTWERCFWDLRERAVPFDEVTYTLLLHGYLLSHRHSAEKAYMVLEEMRQAEIHPALVRLNQRLVDAAFDLRELEARPELTAWLNLVRLSWHCCVRFKKKRQRRLQKELEALEPDDALQLGPDDVRRWLRGHDRLSLPPAGAGVGRFLPTAPSAPLLEASTARPEGRRHPSAGRRAWRVARRSCSKV